MHNIKKFYRGFLKASFKEKKKVIYIATLAIKTTLLIHFCPLKSYFHKYFNSNIEQPIDLSPYWLDIVLIKKVLNTLPGKHTCLKESIVVHLFFRSIGIQVPIFLGVNLKPKIHAHAWYDFNEDNGFTKLVIQNGEKEEDR